jgi:hypothetical protein
LIEEDTKEAREEDMDEEEEEDNGGGGIPPTYFNCGEVGHLSCFCTKLCALCGYFHNADHVMEYFQTCWKNGKRRRGTAIW